METKKTKLYFFVTLSLQFTHDHFSSLSLCKNWFISKLYKKSPQWTFLCPEPSIKKRIWKN